MINTTKVVEALKKGQHVELEDVLYHREQRALLQGNLLQAFPGSTLIALKLNMPGTIKNNTVLNNVFSVAKEDVENKLKQLDDITIVKTMHIDKYTGEEYFWVVNLQAKQVKKAMVELEESTPMGRLLDIDVLVLEEQQQKSLSRTELDLPERQCFVCGDKAKVCGRSRKHSADDIRQAIAEMILEDGRMRHE